MNWIELRKGVKNSVPGVDPFEMYFDYAPYDRMDLENRVPSSVSSVDPLIKRIYFAHVFRVTDCTTGSSYHRTLRTVSEK